MLFVRIGNRITIIPISAVVATVAVVVVVVVETFCDLLLALIVKCS